MYNTELIKKANALYKKDINLIELSFINYEGFNYYIRIDKDKKREVYYLRSINFLAFDKFDKKLMNQEILFDRPVKVIEDLLRGAKIIEQDTSNKSVDIDLVRFKANLNDKEYKYTFNLFIPKNLPFLMDVFYMIFTNLPQRVFPVFEELGASIKNCEMKYLYKKPFVFNIFKDDLKKIYDPKVIEKGEEAYNNQNVRFLEQIHDSFYATLEDLKNNKLYSVLVNYDKEHKLTTLSCTCPLQAHCEHTYAVLKSIRNKERYNYYKVRLVDNKNHNMFDKMFSLNYYLCIGFNVDSLILVFPNGEISSVPILDQEGRSVFEVMEDDPNHSLTANIKDLVNNKRN